MTYARRWGVLVVLVAVPMVGCEKPAQITSTPSGGSSPSAATSEALEKRIAALEVDEAFRKAFDGGTAYLAPGDTGYSVLSTNMGPITVQLIDVKPNGNGSKATIEFGNLLNTTITKLKLDLAWGTTAPNHERSEPVGKLSGYEVLGTLPAGMWSRRTIPLADLPPEKLGYLNLTNADISGISLGRSRAVPPPPAAPPENVE